MSRRASWRCSWRYSVSMPCRCLRFPTSERSARRRPPPPPPAAARLRAAARRAVVDAVVAEAAVGEEDVAAVEASDRFGITWQPGLAAGILAHLDRIDVVEVIAEEQYECSS